MTARPVFPEPSLLFVAPALPVFAGHGAAMRMAAILEAFSARYDVSLLVVNLYRPRQFNNDDSDIASRCRVIVKADCNTRLEEIPLLQTKFDVVHVARLVTFEHLLRCSLGSLLSSGALRTLDLDDYESEAREQLSVLSQSADPADLPSKCGVVDRFRRLEEIAVGTFDRIYVSSLHDCKRLEKRFGQGKFQHVQNSIKMGHVSFIRSETNARASTLLFVGTLDYLPNVDGIDYFCREVLPLLRTMTELPPRVLVLGTRPHQRVRDLAARGDIDLIGEVPTVREYYRMNAVVIVPVRIGGGTCIKTIEAFAWQRAVVSTSQGVRGLGVRHNVHVMVADTPQSFAKCCDQLLRYPALRKRLANNAFAYVQEHHNAERLPALP